MARGRLPTNPWNPCAVSLAVLEQREWDGDWTPVARRAEVGVGQALALRVAESLQTSHRSLWVSVGYTRSHRLETYTRTRVTHPIPTLLGEPEVSSTGAPLVVSVANDDGVQLAWASMPPGSTPQDAYLRGIALAKSYSPKRITAVGWGEIMPEGVRAFLGSVGIRWMRGSDLDAPPEGIAEQLESEKADVPIHLTERTTLRSSTRLLAVRSINQFDGSQWHASSGPHGEEAKPHFIEIATNDHDTPASELVVKARSVMLAVDAMCLTAPPQGGLSQRVVDGSLDLTNCALSLLSFVRCHSDTDWQTAAEIASTILVTSPHPEEGEWTLGAPLDSTQQALVEALGLPLRPPPQSPSS